MNNPRENNPHDVASLRVRDKQREAELEAKLAAAESTLDKWRQQANNQREIRNQPASCGVSGHLVIHEIGDEYGHFYCQICEEVKAAESTRDAAIAEARRQALHDAARATHDFDDSPQLMKWFDDEIAKVSK